MKRTTSSVKGDIQNFIGAGTGDWSFIDTSKPFYVNGSLYSTTTDGFINWNDFIDSEDTLWHRCTIIFTCKSPITEPWKRTIRWRAKKDSSWKVKNIMMFEGSELLGTDFRLHDEEYYDWTFYEGIQGMREVSANFGFYYSED
ncbi:hypothetical protein ACI3QN_12230, partial [Propionibacterium freudenreichii]|uniref:hypothetical protein n=1 Tax=Propionibacterium freudenreichii TaxID=1744 RepID=UPI003854B2C5